MLDFITYLLAETPKDFNPGITKELLNNLWDIFVLHPLVPNERDILFKWLISTLDRNKSQKSLEINIVELINFY